MTGVSNEDFAEKAVKGIAILHDFERSEWDSVFVDTPEGVITNPPWSPFSLWYHSWWAEGESWEGGSEVKRDNDPLGLSNHI